MYISGIYVFFTALVLIRDVSCNKVETLKNDRCRRSAELTCNEYKPSFPFGRDNSGMNKKRYEVSVDKVVDSFNIKGCVYYVVVQGKGVLDHFQVPCFKYGTAVASKKVMVFGTSTTPLGLYSDTRSTLVILNGGVCFKKSYNPTTTPVYMKPSECDKVKEEMTQIRKNAYDARGFEYKITGFVDVEPSHSTDNAGTKKSQLRSPLS